ncbi:MAG: YgiQ family radical SAM protein [Treponema sp.]|jgi:uncharacterized radical SAM protein YgiQ|nr:YgiQ family radical SAM protein [Treponema sp.]
MKDKTENFLPVNRSGMIRRGWDECDFIFVSGDAYVDHPSFAAALLGRLLEFQGYRVGILAQPDFHSVESFKLLGRPRLAFLVSAGAMDSMVANYTANNKPRSSDSYAHGGEKGHRPDRALIMYTTKIKEAYKGVDVVIGGIEASLRRMSHYDYWSNKVRRSVLLDSKADLLIYGMGEHALIEIAGLLNTGIRAKDIRGVRGTCWRTGRESEIPVNDSVIRLPTFEEISANTDSGREEFARSFVVQEKNTDALNAMVLIEQTDTRFVVQERPALPLTTEEFDKIMELPYTRRWHPAYDVPAANGKKGVPALQEVLFSLMSCRGCFGACAFCAITFHQGRVIQARSHESLLREARQLIARPDFKGYIHDVGGPTANFRQPSCSKQQKYGVCKDRQCLGSSPCPNLVVDHRDYTALLKELRSLPGVKKVFIRSGIRFDYLMMDKDTSFLEELCRYHISGQLKVAPESVNDTELRLMRKSSHRVYEKFVTAYNTMNKNLHMEQYLVPYYISAHPGAGLSEAIETALFLNKTGFVPDQIQDFYPTPGSLSTCMYYTGLSPYDTDNNGKMKKIHVARGARERRLQRAVTQFNKKENHQLVREALEEAGRTDLLDILR